MGETEREEKQFFFLIFMKRMRSVTDKLLLPFIKLGCLICFYYVIILFNENE